ncbi:MAG TPA: PP2C family serine/threonine-protein phosphatase, partial [Pyrinomonadaceae bacterium]|nr:PP2C family serine/threonine-protein phosphatase [Pyrinomonadaceae bacterium]
MTENPTGVRVETATVTDRGLNERRPLNEDSMLCDPAHSIFAVADGVGGAEAGEVASKAAIEILQQAFDGHAAGEDAEDLMEIAIQRANDQIYRQSREQPQLSMMATTIVALHVDGLRATVGHVGDSRLYSLTPDGTLRRETEDHSVVEEEVRAGRMTPEQAANHPSRNVISRALGAESSVEVDLRTFDFGSGTTFLLCSDGITRHIADDELAGLLQSVPDLEEACAEMKRLCFERGAEDNLTAVLVRVGGAGEGSHDEEATLIRERPSLDAARAAHAASASPPTLRRPFNDAAAVKHESGAVGTSQNGGATSNVAPAAKRSGGALRAVAVLFLVAAAVAFAFFVGMMFERRGRAKLAGVLPQATPFPAVTPVPAPSVESPEARFAERLRA